MKNKGFTLVELLAVIAILAILVIIALPNVMGMFNTAKKNSFITECKNIYSSAQQSWMSDSVFGNKNQKYSKCSTCTDKKLDLSGRDNIDYYVEYDKSGSIVKFYVTDGTYQYRYEGTGLSKTDIREVDTITDLEEDQVLVISDVITPSNPVNHNTTTVYYTGDEKIELGSSVPNYDMFYNTPQEAIASSEQPYFSKLVITDNVITEAYSGFPLDGSYFYLQGNSSNFNYESTKTLLNNTFGSDYCRSFTNGIYSGYKCYYPEEYYNTNIIVYTDGGVSIGNYRYACTTFEGEISCEYLPQ